MLLRTLNFRVEDEKNLAGTQDAKLILTSLTYSTVTKDKVLVLPLALT